MSTHYIERRETMAEKIVVIIVINLMIFIGIMATITNLGRKK